MAKEAAEGRQSALDEIRKSRMEFVHKDEHTRSVAEVRTIREDVGVNTETLQSLGAEVEKDVKHLAELNPPSNDDFVGLQGRVEILEKQEQALRKRVSALEMKVKSLRGPGDDAGAINQGLLDKCVDELNTLR